MNRVFTSWFKFGKGVGQLNCSTFFVLCQIKFVYMNICTYICGIDKQNDYEIIKI